MEFEIDDTLMDYMVNEMEDAFAMDENSAYQWSCGTENYPVPRITNIIRKCTSTEDLMSWAANVGFNTMKQTQETALTVGSMTHKLIEDYLNTGVIGNVYDAMISHSIAKSVETAFNNFLRWYNNIGYPIEVEKSELQLVSPYCGGTADLVCKINGYKYILDWKTSNSIRTDYFIQAAAYMWIYNKFYNPSDPVQGIGVVRISKKNEGEYNDLVFCNKVYKQSLSIDHFIQGFLSCLNWYYNQSYINSINNSMSMKEISII